MYSREYLSSLIERHIAQLPLSVEPTRLYEPISYSMEGSGKRLRPLILLMAHNIFSEEIESALDVAIAIEMFHNFTLLHDDIMDNSAMRRGKPAVHKKWDHNTAILSGDAMVIYSYSLLGKCNPQYLDQVLSIFNKMALEVCEGQQYDIDFEMQSCVPMDEYINMIRLKTSVLLAGAAQIGAIMGGASLTQSETIYNYAVELGLAFQIQDDILDTYGNEQQLGKPVGGDILEGKKTFLMITAMERGDAKASASLHDLLESNSIDPATKIDSVRTLYDSLDIKHTAQQAVEKHILNAVTELEKLNICESHTAPLKELATSLLGRNK